MTPNEFELLAQNLFEKKLKDRFGCEIPVHHLKKYTSDGGNEYEIDLSYNFNLMDMNYFTLVECKHWDSNITRDKVGYLKAIMDDLKAHKGIIVTTKGFQSGAIEYAQSNNIGLIKITNDKSFETYSHFDGGISEVQELLSKLEIFDSSQSHTSTGLFWNKISVLDFIGIHYGQELANFLANDFNPEILDVPSIKLNPTVHKQLHLIPEDWYSNYVAYETCGLHYNLENENELRMMNMTLYLLKVTKK